MVVGPEVESTTDPTQKEEKKCEKNSTHNSDKNEKKNCAANRGVKPSLVTMFLCLEIRQCWIASPVQLLYLSGHAYTESTYINTYIPRRKGAWSGPEHAVMYCYGTLERLVITPRMGNWSVFVLIGWHFVFGTTTRGTGESPHCSDAIMTLELTKLFLSNF